MTVATSFDPPKYNVDLEELCALARAVALDGSLDVEAGDPGSGWFIRTDTGLINADGHDLKHVHENELRGLICHEAAHAACTRYHDIVPPEIMKSPGMKSLLNALEDCRIEDWLALRFPGTASWIEQYNDRLFPTAAPGLGARPLFFQFNIAAIHQWWHQALPPGIAPEVIDALEETRAAREKMIALISPVDTLIPIDQVMHYEQSRVSGIFARTDRFLPPDAFERAVRLAAFAAWVVVWTEIRAAYNKLLDLDRARGVDIAAEEQRFLTIVREFRFGIGHGRCRRRAYIPLPLGGMPPLAMPPTPFEPGAGTLPRGLRDALRSVIRAPPPNEYERARRDIAHIADPLFNELERILRPDSFPRWVGGYATGSRLDLRAAMRFEARPETYRTLWQRKTLPKKRDPQILVLLDLSGSMSGERIHHGFRATVLVAEVLERLGIQQGIFGFQDELITFKDFTEPFDASNRVRIGEMPAEVMGRRTNGRNHPEHNWDGPVLAAAADRLRERPGNTRILLVMSDGEPSGPSDGTSELRRAVNDILAARDVMLVGIGIGPETDHVREYYPDATANVPLVSLPKVLGQCIERLLRG